MNTDGYQLDLTRDATHDVLYYQWEADKTAEFARDGRPDVYSLPAATPTGTTDTLDFSLPTAHVLNVTVKNDDGTPVENARVGIRSTANSAASRRLVLSTNAEGKLVHTDGSTIGVETAGPVELHVRASDSSSLRTTTKTVTRTADSDVTVTLSSPSQITGSVQTAAGEPAVGDSIAAYTVENGEIVAFADIDSTNETGNFSLTVPDN